MVEQKGGDYINREADALRLSFATTKALRSFPCWPFWTSSDLGPWRTLMLNCKSKIKNDARTDAKKFSEALSLVDCMENYEESIEAVRSLRAQRTIGTGRANVDVASSAEVTQTTTNLHDHSRIS